MLEEYLRAAIANKHRYRIVDAAQVAPVEPRNTPARYAMV
jgi:hypothetical protein